FATGPEPDTAGPGNQLGADAVPLPFSQPVAQVTQIRRITLQWRREKEGIGLALALLPVLLIKQPLIEFGAGLELTHQAARYQGPGLAAERRQGALHQTPGDADPQAAGQQLVVQKAGVARQRAPQCDDMLFALLFLQIAQAENALLDPFGKTA